MNQEEYFLLKDNISNYSECPQHLDPDRVGLQPRHDLRPVDDQRRIVFSPRLLRGDCNDHDDPRRHLRHSPPFKILSQHDLKYVCLFSCTIGVGSIKLDDFIQKISGVKFYENFRSTACRFSVMWEAELKIEKSPPRSAVVSTTWRRMRRSNRGCMADRAGMPSNKECNIVPIMIDLPENQP